ncbi:MAG: DUF4330 domain-containing protein [Bacillota bacterium]
MEGKRKLRFNVVDLVIFVVVLGLLALGAYKLFFVNQALQAQNGTIEYQVLIEEVRQPSVDAFKEGQKVKELQTNIDLGSVVGKEAMPHKEPVATMDGRIVMAEVPGKYDLIVTIQAPAIIGESNITVSNKEIKLGDQVTLKTNISAAKGIIYGVTVKE